MRALRTKLLTAALAMVAMVALGAPAAFAANEIAYECGSDICLIDPAKPSAVTNVTDNGTTSIEERPAWSPNGKKLAFVSRFTANTRNVFVMEPDAPGQAINLAVQVTHYEDGGYLNGPVWSPDGSRIAFVRGASASTRSVLVAASDGTTGTPLTIAEHGQHPSFAPDGGKIAYSYESPVFPNPRQVYLKNTDGTGAAAPLANGAGMEPAWSPDGTFIAFDQTNASPPFVDLHIVNSTGGGTPTVVPDAFSEWTLATWSPDSARVAYVERVEGYEHVRVVNANGSGNHALGNQSALDANSPPSWSPDGTRVVTEDTDLNDPSTSADDVHEVYVLATDGSGSPQQLTTAGEDREPVWRPNPLVSPFVPVVTPSHGSAAPLPATIKPKVVWITKRIPWTPGINPNIHIGVYGCGGPRCAVATEGSAKYVGPPSIIFRPALAAASGKPGKTKPKRVVVSRGKMTVPAGKTRPLTMKLTKAGIALITHFGALKIDVTVTATAPGFRKAVSKKTIRLFYKKPPKHHRHSH